MGGQHQIIAFLLPGDLLALTPGSIHRDSAEAVLDSDVLTVNVERAADDPETLSLLWSQSASQLCRANNHLLLLGRKKALERVATFLLDMAERLPTARRQFELPVSRSDAANYLGLTIESVSRILRQLSRDRIISVPTSRKSRRVVLLDRPALVRLAGGR
jgi:CRP/FNR family nitrogen fixation transcriptional regulator